MKRYAATYLTTFLAFVLIDAVWLTFVAGPQYKAAVGPLLLDQIRPGAAIAFYLIQVAGMMVFVVPKKPADQGLLQTALFGALFGFFTYCTFDLTDFTVLKGWTLTLTLWDIGWGTVLSSMSAVIGVGLAERMLRRRR
jgi:uncharacterized membrane protein